jgi:tRNA-dihydrouridine synthase B
MKIGNLDIGNKLFLAPMAEVTDGSFRKICKEHDVGVTFTQMVSADGVVKNNFETLRLLSFSRSEKPLGVQLLGNDPGILGEATKEISKLKPDLIDLNCGCSVDKVTTNSMGSALLEDPIALGKIIRRMTDNSNGVAISVKLRLGKDRSHINIFDTAKAVEENGGSLVFLHARARSDKYDTDPDWSWIRKVKERMNIPVVGNGSVFTPQDAKQMIDETGCDSVMIARGTLGNPFVFSRFNELMEKGVDPGEPKVDYLKDVVLRHIKNLEQEFGDILALDKAKKHSAWYFRTYPGIDSFLGNVFRLRSLESLRELVEGHTHAILNGEFTENDSEQIFIKFKKKVLFWLPDISVNIPG